MFLGDFGCFPTGPNVVPKIRKLVPDWIPTGQKRCPKMQKLVPDWVPTGSRLGPDWIPTGSRPGFFKKTPISLNLSTYFWNFSTLPCTTPPRFPLRTPPTSLKPNTGLAIYIYIYYIEVLPPDCTYDWPLFIRKTCIPGDFSVQQAQQSEIPEVSHRFNIWTVATGAIKTRPWAMPGWIHVGTCRSVAWRCLTFRRTFPSFILFILLAY